MKKISWEWSATLYCVLAVILVISVTDQALAERYERYHGTIYVDSSAAGPVLDLLSRDYEIADLTTLPDTFTFTPIVIGPAALNDPSTMALVIHAYQAGQTVAIVQATQAQADEFDGLVENGQAASCLPAEGSSVIAFYGVRNPLRQPAEYSRYCLPDIVDHAGRSQRAEREWLDEVFAPTPPPIPEETNLTSGNSLNLDSLSGKIHCDELVSGFYGQIRQDVYVTRLRSFSRSGEHAIQWKHTSL